MAKTTTKKEEVLTNLEYYDLPYRYNETIVKESLLKKIIKKFPKFITDKIRKNIMIFISFRLNFTSIVYS